jgi:hypothetical protein
MPAYSLLLRTMKRINPIIMTAHAANREALLCNPEKKGMAKSKTPMNTSTIPPFFKKNFIMKIS